MLQRAAFLGLIILSGTFVRGKKPLVLGTSERDPNLQAEMIQYNLKRSDAKVVSLGGICSVDRPFSKREIVKIALGDENFKIIATIALVVCALGACFCTWSASSVMSYYKKYRDGWLIEVHYNGISFPPRPLNLLDVIAWGVELAVFNTAYLFFCRLPIDRSISALNSKLDSEREYRAEVKIADLKERPSSGASLTGKVVDCFSKKVLSLSEAQRPRKLTIGEYTGDVWRMINRVLSKEEEYGHPIEDREMSDGEKRKFEADLSNLMIRCKWKGVWSQSTPQERKRAFLQLLPRRTKETYQLESIFGITESAEMSIPFIN